MRRIPFALLAFAALSLPAVIHAQNTPRWADERAHVTPADSALRFTTSGTALTVLFNGFVAAAQSGSGLAPVTRTSTFSARLEEADPPAHLRFLQYLRGSVVKDADARVIIVLVLPDRTETLVFPYGERVDASSLRRTFRSRMRYREMQEYAMSVFVRIDRRTPGATAQVDLHSWDVTVSRAR
jgi:hypothetical protein